MKRNLRAARRWQFGLRFLLIAVAVIALGMHWNSERRAIKLATLELEAAVARFQKGHALPDAVIRGSKNLLVASLDYPFCGNQAAFEKHRDCADKTLEFLTAECFLETPTVDVWKNVDDPDSRLKFDAVIAKLAADVEEAERWVAAGKFDSLGP